MFHVVEVFFFLFWVLSYQNPMCVFYTCTPLFSDLPRLGWLMATVLKQVQWSSAAARVGGGIPPGHLRPSVWSLALKTAPWRPSWDCFALLLSWRPCFLDCRHSPPPGGFAQPRWAEACRRHARPLTHSGPVWLLTSWSCCVAVILGPRLCLFLWWILVYSFVFPLGILDLSLPWCFSFTQVETPVIAEKREQRWWAFWDPVDLSRFSRSLLCDDYWGCV